MDFELSDFQLMIQSSAQNLIKNRLTIEEIRELRNSSTGYSTALWSSISELGWIGLTIPEELNGVGGNITDVVPIFEEIGRSLLPSPYLSQWISSTIIARYANKNFLDEYLNNILSGKSIIALALLEEDGQIRKLPQKTILKKVGSGYLLTGEKRFVLDGSVANGFLVTACYENETVVVFVSADNKNLKVVPIIDAARQWMALISFQDIEISKDDIIGAVHKEKIIEDIWNLGALAVCAELTGASSNVLDLTIEHAKTRIQFSRPIGQFQAVQHKCANIKIDLEICKYITHYAAWMILNDGPDTRKAVSQAKLLVSEASNRIVREGQQIFGGLGLAEEHVMPLYYRFIKQGRTTFGSPAEHRNIIATEVINNV